MRPLAILFSGRTVRGPLELVKTVERQRKLPVPVSEYLSELHTNLHSMAEVASKSDHEVSSGMIKEQEIYRSLEPRE